MEAKHMKISEEMRKGAKLTGFAREDFFDENGRCCAIGAIGFTRSLCDDSIEDHACAAYAYLNRVTNNFDIANQLAYAMETELPPHITHLGDAIGWLNDNLPGFPDPRIRIANALEEHGL